MKVFLILLPSPQTSITGRGGGRGSQFFEDCEPNTTVLQTMVKTWAFPQGMAECLLSRYLGNRYLGALVDELNHILRLAFVRSYEQAF